MSGTLEPQAISKIVIKFSFRCSSVAKQNKRKKRRPFVIPITCYYYWIQVDEYLVNSAESQAAENHQRSKKHYVGRRRIFDGLIFVLICALYADIFNYCGMVDGRRDWVVWVSVFTADGIRRISLWWPNYRITLNGYVKGSFVSMGYWLNAQNYVRRNWVTWELVGLLLNRRWSFWHCYTMPSSTAANNGTDMGSQDKKNKKINE